MDMTYREIINLKKMIQNHKKEENEEAAIV